jgi:hypothetical protein
VIASTLGNPPAEPVARVLAQRVVEELTAFLEEDSDPMCAAMGDLRRKLFATPETVLATDPDIDTLALFVAGRVNRVRNRNGRYLSPAADKIECHEVMCEVQGKIFSRYLRYLRL